MGIFTKKDTNTITGENKYKGWGNTKNKVFESEAQQGAVTAAAGGDLKGKDFRELKRDVHKQKRLNRRALRRAERKGIDPSEVQMKRGQYKELSRREQDIEQYFKDVRKERVENTAEIALTVAAVAATGGAILGAGGAGAGTTGVATASGGVGGGSAIGGGGAIAGTGSGGMGSIAGINASLTPGALTGTTAATTGATAGTTAATAGTTAATTGVKAGLKQAGKKAAMGAIDNAMSGGAQGGFQPDPRVAQMQQQMAMMQQQMNAVQAPQFNFGQTPGFQVPNYQPQQPFTMPPPIAQPSYTAASVYDPFLYQ